MSCAPGATWPGSRRACSAPSRPRPTAARPARCCACAPRDSARPTHGGRPRHGGCPGRRQATRTCVQHNDAGGTADDDAVTSRGPRQYSRQMPHMPAPLVQQDAVAAFLPFDGTLYLDCAARAPRLRSVHAAGLAALEADAMPWAQSFDALEAQAEAVRALVAQLFDGDADAVALVPSVAFALS